MARMKPLTINLPDDLVQRLCELSGREKRSPEEAVCEILRKRRTILRPSPDS